MTSVRSTKYERILNGCYGFVDEIYFSGRKSGATPRIRAFAMPFPAGKKKDRSFERPFLVCGEAMKCLGKGETELLAAGFSLG